MRRPIDILPRSSSSCLLAAPSLLPAERAAPSRNALSSSSVRLRSSGAFSPEVLGIPRGSRTDGTGDVHEKILGLPFMYGTGSRPIFTRVSLTLISSCWAA